MLRSGRRVMPALLAASLLLGASAAQAQLAVSANDGKVRFVDGRVEVVPNGADSVDIIDMKLSPPKVVAEIAAPASVAGPPMGVAVSPKEEIALVTAGQRFDPADGSKLVPGDTLTVIDLRPLKPTLVARLRSALGAAPDGPPTVPSVIATLTAGKGAAGVSINRAGTLALVANHGEGTVSVFTIQGMTVAPAGKVTVGDEKSGPSQVAFTPDGRTALVTLDGESANAIAVLSVDGSKVTATGHSLYAGLRPYTLDVGAKGEVAAVANAGRGQGDNDTVSIIDLKSSPIRVVNTISVGQAPEGLKLSPDARYVAVTVMNGSARPKAAPFHKENGALKIYKRSGMQLAQVAEMPIGKWCRGVVWSANGHTLLVQCMADRDIIVARFAGITGRTLQRTGIIKLKAGPAGIRTAEP